MTRPVFYYEDPTTPLAAASAGALLGLVGEEGRHAATVRRIGVGERLDLVDGRGVRAVCAVTGAHPAGLELRVEELLVEAEPRPLLVLVQALAKGGRDEQAIETCTEIGVDAVIPWQSERAIVRWSGPKADKGRRKWEGVVRAAAKQARRARIPVVEEVHETKALASRVSRAIAEGARAFVCHEEAGESLSALLSSEGGAIAEAGEILIIVGPEGGISPAETDLLVGAGASLVGLGANVLRSSTAGAVCATLLSAACARL